MPSIWKSSRNTDVQHLGYAVLFVMCCQGFKLMNYVDDFTGFRMPSITQCSFHYFMALLKYLGLEISMKKLVEPAMQVICLCMLINTVECPIAILSENASVKWSKNGNANNYCWKHQLQLLLGNLLYIHKCVKP